LEGSKSPAVNAAEGFLTSFHAEYRGVHHKIQRQVRNLVVYSLIFITEFVGEDISMQSVKWHPEMTNGSFLLLQVQRLVHGIRLISGFSVLPVEKKLALAARRLFRTMCTDLIQYCGDQFATHMCHAFLHMVEDVIR
jgi:hypothetical protein